jgi:hypothetical protein
MLILPTLLATVTHREHENDLERAAERRSLAAALRCCQTTFASRLQAARRRSPSDCSSCA